MKNVKSAVIFLLIASAILLIPMFMSSHHEKEVALSVAFYNVENLFDTTDDSLVDDNDFLPEGANAWDSQKYALKLQHLGEVIAQIGYNTKAPHILGICEIENRKVLDDLVAMPGLTQFRIVHTESPDPRGIDVALLYDSNSVKMLNYRAIPVMLSDSSATRDILYASMSTIGHDDILHVMVNHWRSRSGGQAESEPYRLQSARMLKTLVDSILRTDTLAQIIVMGDFNDEPDNRSIAEVLDAGENKDNILYNPFLAMVREGKGSYLYNNTWEMLDQIIVSRGFWDYNSLDYVVKSAAVFSRPWLLEKEGPFKGYPFRTYGGNKYLAGYSDHLPVTIELYRTKH